MSREINSCKETRARFKTVSEKCLPDYIYERFLEENVELVTANIPIQRKDDVCPLNDVIDKNFGYECPLKDIITKLADPKDVLQHIPLEDAKQLMPNESKQIQAESSLFEQTGVVITSAPAIPVGIAVVLIVIVLYGVVRFFMSHTTDKKRTKTTSPIESLSNNVVADTSSGDEGETELRHPTPLLSITNFREDKPEKILHHLQEMANEIKASRPQDNVETCLTPEFLQQVADYIASHDNTELDYLIRLTPNDLLQLGKFNYRHEQRLSGGDNRRNITLNVVVHVDDQYSNNSVTEETDMYVVSGL